MKVIKVHSLDKVYNTKKTTISIGIFDAMHKGHQKVLSKLLKEDKRAVITFDCPVKKKIINDSKDRIDTLSDIKIDTVFVLEQKSIKGKTYKEFNKFLQNNNFSKAIIGSDFKYGKDQKGDINTLKEAIDVDVIDLIQESGKKVSTQDIYEDIEEAKLDNYFNKTGRNYQISGIVTKGKQIGKTIEFPTANLIVETTLPNGVYKTQTIHNKKRYNSITNIGIKPTVGNDNVRSIETNIFSFNKEIYDEVIKVEFLKKIRDERKFNNLIELKSQIEKDKKEVNNDN
ncbi:MAG: riboflavin kinase [Mycoplasmatales bacterium]